MADNSDNNAATLTVEHRGERIAIEENCIGFEYHGRAASHTGYHSVVAPDGIPDESTLVSMAQAQIEAFLQAPYLVGRYDYNDWREIGENWSTGAATIRLPDWHTGELLAELERQGFVLADEANTFIDAPAHLGKRNLAMVVAPLLAPGSRVTPEAQLAKALSLSAARQGDAHKQMALF
ncbi:hypothetical protein [Microbulbifer discodermiae]|uniref:hypothetical protein n=1 Tax=Microbulbifer sp. 2201CG32-9 TaxID=3232309 RepID=UPI00345BFE23